MNTNLKQTTRHCERSEAISSRLPRPYGLAMTNETGRSMVEMLGVLAVIGVLSITGISGYNTAMNKHRANEILDAASKRAVAVSTQIQRGNTSPTLDEFETNTIQGVAFGTPVTVGTDAKQFRLPLTWSSTDLKTTLCKEVKSLISEDGTNSTALIDSDCTRILYNSDLSVGVSNTNNRNTDGTACADGYTGADCDSCADGYTKNTTSGICEVITCNPACGTTTFGNTQLECVKGVCKCPSGTYKLETNLYLTSGSKSQMFQGQYSTGCYSSCGTATVNNGEFVCAGELYFFMDGSYSCGCR